MTEEERHEARERIAKMLQDQINILADAHWVIDSLDDDNIVLLNLLAHQIIQRCAQLGGDYLELGEKWKRTLIREPLPAVR